jgi:type II restriction/modification system DNA methylase subunit YeeA
LFAKHVGGMSYRDISYEINEIILFNICLGYLQEREEKQSKGYLNAQEIMRTLMMKEKDVVNYLKGAIEMIDEGSLPFTKENGPIDLERVRSTIRYAREKFTTYRLVKHKTKGANRVIEGEKIYESSDWPKVKEFFDRLGKRG